MGNCCKSKPVREGVDVAQSENADDEREQRSRKSQKGIVPVFGDTEETKKTNALSKEQPRSRSSPNAADESSPISSPTIKQQEQRTKKTNKNGMTDDFLLENETKRICESSFLRPMNSVLFKKYETIFEKESGENAFSNGGALLPQWPEETEVNEAYLSAFKSYCGDCEGRFLAFHERTEDNESVWFEGEVPGGSKKQRVKMQIEPWDDHEWTSARAFAIYAFAMKHMRVSGGSGGKDSEGGLARKRSMDSSAPAAGDESESAAIHLPDTRKMQKKEERMAQLIRGLGCEYMNHPLFYFCVNFFEGVNIDSGNEQMDERDYVDRCEMFLYRCLDGCQGAVFSKFKDKSIEFGMKHISDSQHLGALAYLKAYVNTRFLKRFPITTNFMHPKLDSQIERIRLSRDVAHKMRAFTFVEASDSHPAALVLSFPDTEAFKDLLSVSAPDCWLALNHFYEWTIAQPNRTRPRDKKLQTPPIFIADVKKLSLMSCTKKNVARLADTFRAAMFHPEPFSRFVIANAPMSVMALFTFGKLFMSESARMKFVMTGSSLQKAMKQAWGLEKEDIPECLGGEGYPGKALSAEEILASEERWLHHKQCIERTRKQYPKYFAKYSEKYFVDDKKQVKTVVERKSNALANSQKEEEDESRASGSMSFTKSARRSKTMPRMGAREKDGDADESLFAGYGEEEMSEKRKKMAFLFLSIVLASFLSMLFKVFILSNNIR